MGECLTPEEKNMLNTLSHKSFCHKPALVPSDIKKCHIWSQIQEDRLGLLEYRQFN